MPQRRQCKAALTDSATLMGVLDPFGVLEEDEVFVQIKKNLSTSNSGINNKQYELIKKVM